jgi:hypothetical protein
MVRGDAYTVSEQHALKGTSTLDGKTGPVESTISATFTVEATEIAANAIVEKHVTFASAHFETNEGGSKQAGDFAVAGKTYVIHNSLSSPYSVEGGAEIGAKELALLHTLVAVRVPDDADEFAGKTFTVGKSMALHDPLLALLDDATKYDVTYTLQRMDAASATFAVTQRVTGKQLGMDASQALQGTIVLDRSRVRPTEIALSGTEKASGTLGGKPAALDATYQLHSTIRHK